MELNDWLSEIRARKAFDPKAFVEERCAELARYLTKYNLTSCVLSLSGGVDSATVLGLLKNVKERLPYLNIIPIAQPIQSTEAIQNRAYEVGEAFGIPVITIDQTEIYESLCSLISANTSLTPFAGSMLKSYMRTPVAYAIASSNNGCVIGTGNLDEDGYLYYYCKFGDGAVDVGLIWDLHKSEVFTLAKYLGVPESILLAPPSADLFPGQTDEGEIGVSYDMVELIYTYTNLSSEEQKECLDKLSGKALEQFIREKEIVDKIHNKGLHKADLNPKNMGKYKF